MDKSAEAFVLAYLQKNGHTDAIAAMKSKKSGGRQDKDESLPSLTITEARDMSTEELVLMELKGGECGAYMEEYDRFRTWALGTFDDTNNELLSVSFPLFVHCYISMIRRGASAAQIVYFWRLFHADHEESYAEEMSQLCGLTTVEQLSELEGVAHPVATSSAPGSSSTHVPAHGQANGHGASTVVPAAERGPLHFVVLALNQKFMVRMSLLGEKILMKFLYESELLLLTSIMAERVTIRKFTGAPTGPLGTALLPGFVGTSIDDQGGRGRVSWSAPGMPSTRIPIRHMDPSLGNRDAGVECTLSNADNSLFVEMITKLVVPKLHAHSGLLPTKPRSTGAPPSMLFSTLVNTYDKSTCLAINRGAHAAVAGFRTGTAQVWSLGQTQAHQTDGASSSSSSSSSSSTESTGVDTPHTLIGHSGAVLSVDIDHTGMLALTGSADESIRMWHVNRGLVAPQSIARYRAPTPVWSVAFSPLGHYFAAGGADSCGCMFAVDHTNRLRVFGGHVSDVNAVTWHPNSLSVFTASGDRTARMFDIRDARSVRWFKGAGSSLCSATVSSDGSLLACGSEAGAVTVWDIPTSRRLATLEGHEGAVHSLTFRQNRNELVTGGADCSVRLWDLSHALQTYHANSQLRPSASFFTKQSPVHYVGCTAQDLLVGGGPYTLSVQGGRYVNELRPEHKVASLGVAVIPPPPL